MRVIFIILDGLGIGAMPDAQKFGDSGSNTLGTILKEYPNLKIENLAALGLLNIEGRNGQVDKPTGNYGKMAIAHPGKDTTGGHWELMGLLLEKNFPTFPDGFPNNLMDRFKEVTGYGYLGNKAASGTVIIEELGRKHMETGKLIVYTSADSVLQIAAHEEVIPLEELYKICQKARQILQGPWGVGRVIARPFVGTPGNFIRTSGRKDFSIPPPDKTLLDCLINNNYSVFSIGKVASIFTYRGISKSFPATGNKEIINTLLQIIEGEKGDLVLANLVDFDMLYGHRNDVQGFARALEDFDSYIPRILRLLKPQDILFMTADHGCDPGHPGTDHTREYVPLLVWGKEINEGINLGSRSTMADAAATIADFFSIEGTKSGQSFWRDLRRR